MVKGNHPSHNAEVILFVLQVGEFQEAGKLVFRSACISHVIGDLSAEILGKIVAVPQVSPANVKVVEVFPVGK